jgi:cysteine desulfurase
LNSKGDKQGSPYLLTQMNSIEVIPEMRATGMGSRQQRIYLDHNATTPVDPAVLEEMLPWFSREFGNAASRDHAFGWDAKEAVENARHEIAEFIGAGPHEIFFTSGTTEAIDLGLKTGMTSSQAQGKRLLTSHVEHPSLQATCGELERTGASVVRLPVDGQGQIDLDAFSATLKAGSFGLVAMMAANNETGVRFPIREMANICRNRGVSLFVDAAQAVGKIDFQAAEWGVDRAAFSAHKMYGPKGIGALFIRGGQETLDSSPAPMIQGGKSQKSGTLNVPAIVGFGAACKLARERMDTDIPRLRSMREHLENGLLQKLPQIRVIGNRDHRIPNTSNICFTGCDARQLIRDVHVVAVSTRSACSTNETGRSHVLKAMGLSDWDCDACIRFSLGRTNTLEEMDTVVDAFSDAYLRLLSMRRDHQT